VKVAEKTSVGEPLHRVSLPLVLFATLVAVVFAVRVNPRGYGWRRQVPQHWIRARGAAKAYAAWGVLLGAGVVTVVPHSAYLVLLAAELVSGPAAGTLAGAVFGFTRGLTAVVLAQGREPSEEIANVLSRVQRLAARGYVAVAALGGFALLGAIAR
jgi:hypothetical protein